MQGKINKENVYSGGQGGRGAGGAAIPMNFGLVGAAQGPKP